MRLVTFLDNHDHPRFLSSGNANNNIARLNVALAFLYTSRGIPCLYYGTEQGLSGSGSVTAAVREARPCARHPARARWRSRRGGASRFLSRASTNHVGRSSHGCRRAFTSGGLDARPNSARSKHDYRRAHAPRRNGARVATRRVGNRCGR